MTSPRTTRRLGLATALALLGASQVAGAEAPRGMYLPADPQKVSVAPPGSLASHSSNLLYLNGCFDGGCDFTPGPENSRANTSSIISRSGHLDAFSGEAAQWQAIVDCVRDTYAPFDIIVTDEDPGPIDHFEAIVAGSPEDIGMPIGAAGVAPFLCGNVINNAITFTFASFLDNNAAETCWTIAQESAHAFGLDHEFLCSDPMTYLRTCGVNKLFQDVDAPCGEFQSRACACNGNTQNSYQSLLSHFGAGVPTPPEVAITSPLNGDQVEKGFIVRAEASDDIEVKRVELRINNALIGTSESAPYLFNVPVTVSDGRMELEVTAVDNYNYKSSAHIAIIQGQPCRKSSQCGEFEACVAGRCVAGPDIEGGLGQSCTSSAQCLSGRCGTSSEGSFCTEVCGNGQGGCPNGFGCLDTAEGSVCWPGYDDGSDGGCAIGKSRASLTWLICLVLVCAVRRRRTGC